VKAISRWQKNLAVSDHTIPDEWLIHIGIHMKKVVGRLND